MQEPAVYTGSDGYERSVPFSVDLTLLLICDVWWWCWEINLQLTACGGKKTKRNQNIFPNCSLGSRSPSCVPLFVPCLCGGASMISIVFLWLFPRSHCAPSLRSITSTAWLPSDYLPLSPTEIQILQYSQIHAALFAYCFLEIVVLVIRQTEET